MLQQKICWIKHYRGDGCWKSLVCEETDNTAAAAAAAKLLQSCPTLCDPIDSSPPGSPVPGILQARTLEWVAISFSNAWKWKVKVKSLSRVWLLVIPWTTAYQAPPSMGFSRQEYWSGVPLPSRRSCIQSAKMWLGADCGVDHELLIAKFRLKIKKVGSLCYNARN